MSAPTFASDLSEMMTAWSRIEAAARNKFPDASPEELFEICCGAMNYALDPGKLFTKESK